MGDVSHLRRDALRTVQRYVRQSVEARLLEIGDGQGCEASAARAFEHGRLQAVDDDAWHALGLYRDGPGPRL